MESTKPTKSARMAFANTKKQYREILKRAKIVGVRMRLVMVEGEARIKLYGGVDDEKLAILEIEKHTRPQPHWALRHQ